MKFISIIFIFFITIASTLKASENELLSEESAVAKAYDHYYLGGKDSTFGLRFGKRETIPREEEVIKGIFEQVYSRNINNGKKANSISLLDFGCGHGRFLDFYQELAHKYLNNEIEVIGYDISIVGLNEFANRLHFSGFKKIAHNKQGENASIVSEWKKNNLKVVLLHSSGIEGAKEIKTLFGKPLDILITMYATLCHISGRSNRQATVKYLSEQVGKDGLMLINVSTPRSMIREYNTYQVLRSQLGILDKHKASSIACSIRTSLKNATENGDFYYCKDNTDSASFIFGHAYSKDEIIEDILSVDLKIKDSGVISINEPYQLSKTTIEKYLDQFAAKILSINLPFYPFNKLDELSNSIFMIASR